MTTDVITADDRDIGPAIVADVDLDMACTLEAVEGEEVLEWDVGEEVRIGLLLSRNSFVLRQGESLLECL